MNKKPTEKQVHPLAIILFKLTILLWFLEIWLDVFQWKFLLTSLLTLSGSIALQIVWNEMNNEEDEEKR